MSLLSDTLGGHKASMKCSSRRNCNNRAPESGDVSTSLNEVQFPKELQPLRTRFTVSPRRRLNEVQFPKELQPG